MSTLSLRLPDSLHARLRDLAAQEGISINQLVTLAAAEKVASILAFDYLESRARAADLPAFARLLDRVPDVAAAPGDELPSRPTREVAEVREPSPRYSTKTKRKSATKSKEPKDSAKKRR